MSSDLEIRSLTFDRAGVVIPVPDTLNGPLPKFDWSRSGTTVTASPVALPRTTTAPAVDAKVKIKIKKLLPPGTKVRATLSAGYPLAGVAPRTLPLTTIGTHIVDFHVELPSMAAQATGAFVVALDWQVKKPASSWTTFDTTTHRVLVLADEPVIPWARPGVVNRVVPWGDVLEQACRWSTGQQRTEDCVTAIARGVYALGGQTIQHSVGDDTVIEYGDGSSFDNGNGGFFLINFLETVSLKKDADGFLNCSDLAGAVALLSSAIGCRVGVARVEPTATGGTVNTHFMQLIGQPTPVRSVFQYHEFSATIATSGSTVSLGAAAWDACGKLDKQTSPPPTSLVPPTSHFDVPANWALKSGAAPVYSAQLLASTHQIEIDLIQHDGILFPEQLPTISAIAVDKFLLQREHDIELLLDPVPLPTNPVSAAITAKVRTILLKNTSMHRERVTWATNRPYPNVVARLRPTAGPQTIRMSFATAGFDAHKIFLRWAARFVTRIAPRTGIGHAAIHAPQSDSIVMRVGDTVIQLTSEGKTLHAPVPSTVDVIAQSLANDLKTIYP